MKKNDKIEMKKRGRKKTKNIYFPRFFFILLGFLAILGIMALFFLNKYYLKNYMSSLNRAEIKKEQHAIPPDVKKKSLLNSKVQETYRIPVFMYHYVEHVQDKGDTIRISLNTPPYILEQQIKTLLDAGYIFLTNSELSDGLDGKTKLPAKTVLITFDDGYRDFYTDVFPILKKYNIKATTYIVSGFINKPNNMLSTQINKIIKSGLVEIGAHTANHAWLKGRDLKEVTDEVAQSKTTLEDEFNVPVVSFAYPYGAFDDQTTEVVKSLGFKSAVSTVPGIEQSEKNKYFLFRLRPGGKTGQDLLDWLNQETFKPY